MKFETSIITFKSAVERAAAVVDTKSEIVAFKYLKIEAIGKMVTVSAMDGISNVEIAFSADITEEGAAYVEYSSLKKILNFKDMLTVTAQNNIFTLSSNEKERSIKYTMFDIDAAWFITPLKKEHWFDISTKEFIDKFSVADKARAVICEMRPVIEGFHINSKSKYLITTDGYRMSATKIDINTSQESSHTVAGCIYTQLRKIASKKTNALEFKTCETKNNKVSAIAVMGNDFIYNVRVLDGEFLNYEVIMNAAKEFSFRVNANEIGDAVKEYIALGGASNSINGIPVKFEITDNKQLHMKYESADAKCNDNINIISEREIKSFRKGFTPRFLKETVDVFGKEIITVGGTYRETNGMYFTNDTTTIFVLPVRLYE